VGDDVHELLALVVDAHGGLRRWEAISTFRAVASITGTVWVVKGRPGVLEDVIVEGATDEQRLTISPFPTFGQSAVWTPRRQSIESSDGRVVAERREPATSFAGINGDAPWDHLQVGYFASESTWNSFVAPFLFTRSDFLVEEITPWREDGQVWRRLLVTYPDHVAAHCRQQSYAFDDAGLLQRVAYVVEVLGDAPMVEYPSDYRTFDGIAVPTRRRVFARRADGSPVHDLAAVAIDIGDVVFIGPS
jgi:hypothetical protein